MFFDTSFPCNFQNLTKSWKTLKIIKWHSPWSVLIGSLIRILFVLACKVRIILHFFIRLLFFANQQLTLHFKTEAK